MTLKNAASIILYQDQAWPLNSDIHCDQGDKEQLQILFFVT